MRCVWRWGVRSGVFQLDNFDVEASLHAAEAARAGGGLQVLLVEDNLVNQELALHLLERPATGSALRPMARGGDRVLRAWNISTSS